MKITDEPSVQTQNGRKARTVSLPLAAQNTPGSLPPYAFVA